MQSEVLHAISRTKHGKVSGPDNVQTKKLPALEEFGVEQLTRVMNDIYDTGYILTDS